MGIRDDLTVGHWSDGWRLRYWYPDNGGNELVHAFPREDEVYGVLDLIVEYVERHDYAPERAIAQAMIEYREALAGEFLGNGRSWDALGYVG